MGSKGLNARVQWGKGAEGTNPFDDGAHPRGYPGAIEQRPPNGASSELSAPQSPLQRASFSSPAAVLEPAERLAQGGSPAHAGLEGAGIDDGSHPRVNPGAIERRPLNGASSELSPPKSPLQRASFSSPVAVLEPAERLAQGGSPAHAGLEGAGIDDGSHPRGYPGAIEQRPLNGASSELSTPQSPLQGASFSSPVAVLEPAERLAQGGSPAHAGLEGAGIDDGSHPRGYPGAIERRPLSGASSELSTPQSPLQRASFSSPAALAQGGSPAHAGLEGAGIDDGAHPRVNPGAIERRPLNGASSELSPPQSPLQGASFSSPAAVLEPAERLAQGGSPVHAGLEGAGVDDGGRPRGYPGAIERRPLSGASSELSTPQSPLQRASFSSPAALAQGGSPAHAGLEGAGIDDGGHPRGYPGAIERRPLSGASSELSTPQSPLQGASFSSPVALAQGGSPAHAGLEGAGIDDGAHPRVNPGAIERRPLSGASSELSTPQSPLQRAAFSSPAALAQGGSPAHAGLEGAGIDDGAHPRVNPGAIERRPLSGASSELSTPQSPLQRASFSSPAAVLEPAERLAQGGSPAHAHLIGKAPHLRRDPLLWLLLALTIFAIAPFLLPGYHWGANDARHHVYFLFEFDRAMQDGVWWPRWSPDFTFGYGYPFFNIYGPLSHFVAQFFLRGLNFSYTGAIEAVFVVSILGSAVSMYGFIRSWMGRHSAFIAALVYVYVPYRLLNLYVRAHVVESMAFVWLPLCLWTLREAVRVSAPNSRPLEGASNAKFGWFLGVALSLSGLLLTSQLIMLLFAPLFALYFVVLLMIYGAPNGATSLDLPLWVRFGIWVQTAIPAVLGGFAALGLSSIFWLPMVLEQKFVNNEQWFDGRYDFHGHFVYFFQLLRPAWGFGASVVGPDDPISFQIGTVALLLAVLGIAFVWPKASGPRSALRWEIGTFVAVGIGATLISMQIAAPLWDLPIIGGIVSAAQFPWRWLSMTALCVSVLAGLIMHPLAVDRESASHHLGKQNGLTPQLLVVAIVVLLGSYPLLQIQITEPAEGPVSLAALMQFQRTSDELTGITSVVDRVPTWSRTATQYLLEAEQNPQGPILPITTKLDNTDAQMEYSPTDGHVADSIRHNSVMEEVWYFSAVDDWSIIFDHFYYPGWKAYLLDGEGGEAVRELEIVPGVAVPTEGIPSGRMTVPVPKGEGYLLLRFEDTLPRTVGKYVSLATAVLLLTSSFVLYRRRRKSLKMAVQQ